ncbi:MAG TPA: hypothetical protein VFV38_43660 [Ktedonobacteraceae bacterium]|nr:hypothetical protein [Ktedonobacteraceae bacterium]
MASSATAYEKVFVGPGLSPFKRVVTILGVILLLALVLWIGMYEGFLQGGSAVGSTIVAILFILGFVYYLRLIAPVPFTIHLEEAALVKRSKKGEVVEIPWENLTRIKEEFFHNGKRIGITAFRKPASPQEKAKAWAVYRDDVTDIDALAQALRETIPETCEWVSETVHE